MNLGSDPLDIPGLQDEEDLDRVHQAGSRVKPWLAEKADLANLVH